MNTNKKPVITILGADIIGSAIARNIAKAGFKTRI